MKESGTQFVVVVVAAAVVVVITILLITSNLCSFATIVVFLCLLRYFLVCKLKSLHKKVSAPFILSATV